MANPGSMDFYMDLDVADLEATLIRLETSLSPAGLSMFLTGAVAPWILERAENRFMNEGDDVSGKWAPLAPTTQEIRGRGDWGVGPAHPINRRTGDLEEYVTKSSSSILPWSEGSMLVYPDKAPNPVLEEKLKTAQSGKSKPKTPARPVIGLSTTDLAYVLQGLSVFLETGVVR